MIVGLSIDFPSGKQYLSTEFFTYGGNDYIPIITGVTSLKVAIGDDHNFNVSNMKVTISDHNGDYKAMLDTGDRAIANREAILIKADGTVLRKFLIENGYPAVDGNGAAIFIFDLSDRVLELDQNVIPLIDQNYYPNCPFDANFGKPIPRVYLNNPLLDTTCFIICYRVNKTDAYEYVASSKLIDQVIYATDCEGIVISPLPTITNFEGIYYLTTVREADCILANLSDLSSVLDSPYLTIKDVIETYLPNFVDGTFSDTALSNRLLKQDNRRFYNITEKTTGAELMRAFCDSYAIDWYVDGNRNIKFVAVNPANITISKFFQAAEVADFEIKSIDIYNYATSAIINYGYNNCERSYNQSHQFQNDTADDFGVTVKEIDAPYLDDWVVTEGTRVADANKTWKTWRVLNRYPRIIATATFPIPAAEGIALGEFIELPHENAISTSARLYQVRGIDTDITEDTIALTLWDYEHLKNIRTDDKLLISATPRTVAGSDIILDNAVDGWYSIQNDNNLVAWSGTETLFGKPTLRFPGYLAITRNNGYAIYPADMAQFDEFTFDFWAKLDATGIAAGFFYFIEGNSRWSLRKNASDQLVFVYIDSGVGIILEASAAIVTTAWSHIAVIRSGSIIGVYYNGTQVIGTSTAISPINVTTGFFGQKDDTGATFAGYAGEIHMTHSNPFGAAPVVGLTDTITVRTSRYTDEVD